MRFFINNNNLQIILTTKGPLIYGSHNTEVLRLNNLIQTIIGVGTLLDFSISAPWKEKYLI